MIAWAGQKETPSPNLYVLFIIFGLLVVDVNVVQFQDMHYNLCTARILSVIFFNAMGYGNIPLINGGSTAKY